MTAGRPVGRETPTAQLETCPHITAHLQATARNWMHEAFSESLVVGGITGSVAAQLSNCTSNLDVWVAVDDASYPIGKPLVRERHLHDGLRIHALLFRRSEWVRVIRSIKRIDLSVRSRESICLESIMNSKCMSGNELFDKLITYEAKQAYLERLLVAQRDKSLSIFLDYIGALDELEPAHVTELLQSLFRSELECALILRGDTYREAKWLPKRILRSSELAEKYYTVYRDVLLRPAALGTAEWTKWINSVWSSHVDVQWDILFGQQKMTSLKVDNANVGVSTAYRDAAKPMLILRIDNRYYCKTTDRQFELSELAACLACQPKTTTPSGQFKIPADATTEQLEKAFNSLARSGLLTIQ